MRLILEIWRHVEGCLAYIRDLTVCRGMSGVRNPSVSLQLAGSSSHGDKVHDSTTIMTFSPFSHSTRVSMGSSATSRRSLVSRTTSAHSRPGTGTSDDIGLRDIYDLLEDKEKCKSHVSFVGFQQDFLVPPFIKPDQLDPRIKDQVKTTLLPKILRLLRNLMRCGSLQVRAKCSFVIPSS